MPVVWDTSESEASPDQAMNVYEVQTKLNTNDDPFLTNPELDEDEDDILRSWQIFTKMKNLVQSGNRYENASWRRWYQKRNGIKISSFAEADNFKQYTDDSVFRVLSKFDKNNTLKEMLDKSLDLDSQITDSPSTPASEGDQKPLRKLRKSVLKGLGIETDSHEYISEEEETENETENSSIQNDFDTDEDFQTNSLVLSPPMKRPLTQKKAKKTVRFDESLNQTTFVRYTPDTWITTSTCDNVDEYCKMEKRKRGLIVFETEAETTSQEKSPENEVTKKDSSQDNFLLILDTALTLIFEVGSFLQWCRSSLFK